MVRQEKLELRTSKYLPTNIIQRQVKLTLPQAHPKQEEFITALDRNPDLRFVCGACGTKFGKTFGSTIAVAKYSWENFGSTTWWVAPTFQQSQYAMEAITRLLPKGMFRLHKADYRIEILTPNGDHHSDIWFKSADNESSLRGFGVDFFVMDEAARCSEQSWVSLFTTVTQTLGRGLLISTPMGRGWYYDVYMRGVKTTKDGYPLYGPNNKDPFPEWWSIRMPTWMNPTVSKLAVRQMKANMTEAQFMQEVAANFLTESAGVFNGVRSIIKGVLQPPVKGAWGYVMGVDLGRLQDYTVITVLDSTGHLVYFERFNKISWARQQERIRDVSFRYNAPVCLDTTGIGDPILERLRNMGVVVRPYKIGGSSAKQQLIEKLAISIERGNISIPMIPELIDELERYESNQTPSGVVQYSAPRGRHDDCVISLALANWLYDRTPIGYRYNNVRGI